MLRALVVGGREDFVRLRVGHNLNKVGIDVGWHYDFEHPTQVKRGVPKNCELVIVLADMCPREMIHPIRAAARQQGVPCVTSQRKWSVMLNDLVTAGMVNGPIPAAGEQLIHNAEELVERGLIPPPPTPETTEMAPTPGKDLPVRVVTQERTTVKTFDEVVADLKSAATALMLAHDVVLIHITADDGIDIQQVRKVKVAL